MEHILQLLFYSARQVLHGQWTDDGTSREVSFQYMQHGLTAPGRVKTKQGTKRIMARRDHDIATNAENPMCKVCIYPQALSAGHRDT